MSGDGKRPTLKFELQAGPRLVLKPAADPAPAAPAAAEAAGQAKAGGPASRQSQKELILRLVEAVKGL